MTIEQKVRVLIDIIRGASADKVIKDLVFSFGHPDGFNTVKSVYDFVKNNIDYVEEPFGQDNFQYPTFTLKTRFGDCLTGDTEIICSKNGYYTIQRMDNPNLTEYEALSFNFNKVKYEFKPILNVAYKGEKEVYEVKLQNGGSFKATEDHKLIMVILDKKYNFKEFDTQTLGWLKDKLESITERWKQFYRIAVVRRIPTLNEQLRDKQTGKYKPLPIEIAWLYGHYLAEGWHSCHKVSISGDINTIKAILDEYKIPYYLRRRGSSSYITVNSSTLKDNLITFGSNSFNKHLPEAYLSLSKKRLLSILEGYTKGDGYLHPKKHSKCKVIYNTSSDKLAQQLRIIHWILGRPLYSWYQRNHKGLGNHPIWRLYEFPNSHFNREIIPGVASVNIKSITLLGKEKVYDITVQDNHNFVLADSGAIVHNCEDHTALLGSIFKAQGYNVAVKVAKTGQSRYHVYPLVQVDGRWIPVDTTIKKPLGSEVRSTWTKVYLV